MNVIDIDEEKNISENICRHIQIDNWIFEVKMVRALRVKNYGEPYSAIANINLYGSSACIDGILHKDQQQLSYADLQVLTNYCQKMAVDEVNIDSINHFFTPASETASNIPLKQA